MTSAPGSAERPLQAPMRSPNSSSVRVPPALRGWRGVISDGALCGGGMVSRGLFIYRSRWSRLRRGARWPFLLETRFLSSQRQHTKDQSCGGGRSPS